MGMIDQEHPAASWFLLLAPTVFLILYALPLLVAPFRWARLFRWTVNERDDLALYFGRCLGALAVAVCAACYRAAPHPLSGAIFFDLIASAGVLLAGVHIWGAIEKRQPFIETVEILLYLGLAVLSVVLRP